MNEDYYPVRSRDSVASVYHFIFAFFAFFADWFPLCGRGMVVTHVLLFTKIRFYPVKCRVNSLFGYAVSHSYVAFA